MAVIATCALVLLLSVLSPAPGSAASPDALLDRGTKAFERGSFEEAASAWTEAVRGYEDANKPGHRYQALMRLARAQMELGQYRQAVASLEAAQAVASQLGDRKQIGAVVAALGTAHVALGPADVAEVHLKRAEAIARETGDDALRAVVLNDLGNLLTNEGRDADATTAHAESAELAVRTAQPALAARALINAAAGRRAAAQAADTRALLDRAREQARQLPRQRERAFVLTSIGVAYRGLRPALPDASDDLLLRASDALNEARSIAEDLGDRRTASWALGHLGTLYQDEHRHEEALALTRRAILAAQQVTAPESLYRWQWQSGRLLRQLGARDDALAAYRRALATLQSIRPELAVGYGSPSFVFRDSVGPLYFELVDLLLQRAASLSGSDQVGLLLVEAREVVESFKAAELRDYFRDDCVDAALAKATTLDVVSKTAVIVYPIVLPDRIELLVSLPSGLKRVGVPVAAEVLTREAHEFRRTLEKRTTRQYLPHAQRLYEWLIRPLEGDLATAAVNTLIFVPDGALRSVPMAALHDGKQFLIQRYALGITPGMNLTDPRPISREQTRVLAVGVTEAVQGFPPLPAVAVELEGLRTMFGTAPLVNRDFQISALEKQLKDERYSIVHIASHGEFASDVRKTFLLAFDGKLTMDRLDQLVGLFRYRETPLELLTLSACDTAEGDDRAAMGLAGIAVKAGARSALASLWNINDDASADLVTEFYRGLQDPGVSRAVALQRAQLKLLGDPRYEHPGFWSAYLLINNWL
jgi:CHAT domain-containing protein